MAPTVEQRHLTMLTEKKSATFAKLQKLYDLSKDLTSEAAQAKFLKLVRYLSSTRTDLLKLIDEVIDLNMQVDEKFIPNYDILETIDEMCAEIEDAANQLSLKAVRCAESERAAVVKGAMPQLPKIELPSFSGEIREWEAFHSIFESMIHRNQSLSKVDKLYYLMGCLKGPARSVGAGISLSGENYEIVWKALTDRYQDTRMLASSYFEQMVKFKPLKEVTERGLSDFLERFDAAVRALKNLNLPDLADFLLATLALEKLGDATPLFESARTSPNMPGYEEVVTFVKRRVKILSVKPGWSTRKTETPSVKRVNKTLLVSGENPRKEQCNYCQGPHSITGCGNFRELSAEDRYNLAQTKGWCFNCLSEKHGVRFCPVKTRCFRCREKHHTFLHGGRGETKRPTGVGVVPAEDDNQGAACLHSRDSPEGSESGVLLGTVVAIVQGTWGSRPGRFVLDSGSQVTIITASFCRKAGLAVAKAKASIQGLGGTTQSVTGRTDVTLTARHNPKVRFGVKALVLEQITGSIPQHRLSLVDFPQIKDLQLADETFYIPGRIDGVLGADLVADILGTNHISLGDGPIAVETKLGYVLMGKLPQEPSKAVSLMVTEAPLDGMIRKFWELEEVPEIRQPESQESECDEHYRQTYRRDTDGRFTVALPFQQDPKVLGDSWKMARRRFLALEGKFGRNPEMKRAYVKAVRDFIDQGHLRQVEENSADGPSYFIPHHAVYKPESSSTPVRIVLDASAPSDSGVSLNSILHGGPKLQLDIFELLIGFRLFRVAFTADLRQMYRQINLCEEHRKFQRIIWRENPEEKLQIWELKPLAFGLTCSPYLALRTVQQLLAEEEVDFPRAAEEVRRSLYMDDLVVSVAGVDEAVKLCTEVSALFARGKFQVTKWASNSRELLEGIPPDRRLDGEVFFRSATKILGTVWDPEADIFRIQFPPPSEGATKRSILSAVARCYDPLGVAAPLLLFMKALIKELWEARLDWDDEVPPSIQKRWKRVSEEWPVLKDLKLERHFGGDESNPVTVYGFADASKGGYGAVLYLQAGTDKGVKFVCAKSRVAPVKVTTIPRLELCAALLLAKLLRIFLEVIRRRVEIRAVWAFSDSTTVLQWLTTTSPLESFVSSRVAKIKENLPEGKWRHIPGAENPADCLSRGLTPQQLVENHRWLVGPSWLGVCETEWPGTYVVPETTDEPVVLCQVQPEDPVHPLLELVDRKSSWMSILRITVWVLRFGKCSSQRGGITLQELREAEKRIIRVVQENHFATERRLLEAGREVSGKLKNLRPFLESGLLRVGGRLEHANLRMEQKHPIILPGKCEVTNRIVDYYHRINLHAGPYLLEALLRQSYWILSGKTVIKGRVRRCNRCFRTRPRTISPLMGDLPECRVSVGKAFIRTGVDYFGPISVTTGRVRGAVTTKAYGCLFVCMAVKAVHLELVSSLATEHFLQAFRRFLARRGPCKELFSDRGTNFVGAHGALQDLYRLVSSSEFNTTVQRALAEQATNWSFNPAGAPHMGGLWEANVKSVKGHLLRVVGEQKLTYEELATLLTQIECLLNSRPLCVLSSDPEAPEALTPAHFLTLTPLKVLPLENLEEENQRRLDRFQLLGQMVQGFWKRWRLEYLTTLQTRPKWTKRSGNLEKGSVVVVRTELAPHYSGHSD